MMLLPVYISIFNTTLKHKHHYGSYNNVGQKCRESNTFIQFCRSLAVFEGLFRILRLSSYIVYLDNMAIVV